MLYWIYFVIFSCVYELAFGQFNSAYLEPVFNKQFIFNEIFFINPNVDEYINSILLQYDYLDQPIIINDKSPVSTIHTLRLGSAIGISNHLLLGGHFANHYVKLKGNKGKISTGDSVLVALWGTKHILLKDLDLFGGSRVGLPSGRSDLFLSDGDPFYEIVTGASWKKENMMFASNISYRLIDTDSYDRAFRKSLKGTAGVGVAFHKNYHMQLEWFGQADVKNRSNSFGETLLGVSKDDSLLTYQIATTWSNFKHKKDSRPRILFSIKYKSKTEHRKQLIQEEQCSNELVTKRFFIRPIENQEYNVLQLPYKSVKEIPTIGIGQMTGRTSGNIPYVENSQVVFAVDIKDLPEREMVISIEKVFLHMDIIKYSKDKQESTEIFCIVNDHICSGNLFKSKRWTNYINPSFFVSRLTVNEYFSNVLLENSIVNDTNRRMFSYNIPLDFSKLIPDDISLVDLLYGTQKKSTGRKLFFVVADDVFVSSEATIDISMKAKICRHLNIRL